MLSFKKEKKNKKLLNISHVVMICDEGCCFVYLHWVVELWCRVSALQSAVCFHSGWNHHLIQAKFPDSRLGKCPQSCWTNCTLWDRKHVLLQERAVPAVSGSDRVLSIQSYVDSKMKKDRERLSIFQITLCFCKTLCRDQCWELEQQWWSLLVLAVWWNTAFCYCYPYTRVARYNKGGKKIL